MRQTLLTRVQVRAALAAFALVAIVLNLSGCGPNVVVLPKNQDEVPRISPADLKAHLDSGEEILIVDSRSSGEFNSRHIAGAISVPLEEVPARLDEFPKDREIVFY